MTNSESVRFDALVQNILRSSYDDGSASDMLRLIERGAPMESLRLLLTSELEFPNVQGAWMLYELRARASELKDLIPRLVDNRSWRVRYYLVDYALCVSSPDDGILLLDVIRLLGDRDSRVRFMSAYQFAQFDDEFFIRASRSACHSRSMNRYAPHLEDLVSTDTDLALRQILSGDILEQAIGYCHLVRLLPNSEPILNKLCSAGYLFAKEIKERYMILGDLSRLL